MSKEADNKAVVGRWFTEFWGKDVDLAVVDEIAAPEMVLKYSLHEPRRGRDDIKAFMSDFRSAFPDLSFWGTDNCRPTTGAGHSSVRIEEQGSECARTQLAAPSIQHHVRCAR